MPVPLPTSVAAQNDMPEYSNLPQPRQAASIASAAAAVAAAAQAQNSSFNSKRSRHSSLWSLQDEQELEDHSTSDMVNYVNDPFGHQNGLGGGSAGSEFSAGIMMTTNSRDEMEDGRSQMRSYQNNPRHSNASNEM